MSFIQVKNIEKYFGEFKILDNISNVVKLPAEELATKINFIDYYNGTKGASTDKRPRETRIEALRLIIESYINNEVQ